VTYNLLTEIERMHQRLCLRHASAIAKAGDGDVDGKQLNHLTFNSLESIAETNLGKIRGERDSKARARLSNVMSQLLHAYTSTGDHYHTRNITDAARQDSWLPGFQGVSVNFSRSMHGLTWGVEQFIVYYIVSFFYAMYYILSSDVDFPDDEEVENALDAPNEPASKAILEQCMRQFWRMPATTLRGILPGVLDRWDKAYSEHIPSDNATAVFNPNNKKWMAGYLKYASAAVDAYSTLATSATYTSVPARATARLRFFLFAMTDYHSAMPFPTAAAVTDIESMFKNMAWAIPEVRFQSGSHSRKRHKLLSLRTRKRHGLPLLRVRKKHGLPLLRVRKKREPSFLRTPVNETLT